jgi:transcriptional regulator with XRE-family HTH domain
MPTPSIDNLPEIEAEFIKARRESLNISRFDLAKKLCITEGQLEQIENGQKDKFYSYHHKNQVARKVAAELGIKEQDLFKRKFSIGFTIEEKSYSILVDKNKEFDKSEALINNILSKNLNVELVVSEHSLTESTQTLDDLPKIKPDFDKKLGLISFSFFFCFAVYLFYLISSGHSFFSKPQQIPSEIQVNLSDVAKDDFRRVLPLIAESCPFTNENQSSFHILTVIKETSIISLSNSIPSKICIVYIDNTVKESTVSASPMNLEVNSRFSFVVSEKPETLLITLDGVSLDISDKTAYIKLQNMF